MEDSLIFVNIVKDLEHPINKELAYLSLLGADKDECVYDFDFDEKYLRNLEKWIEIPKMSKLGSKKMWWESYDHQLKKYNDKVVLHKFLKENYFGTPQTLEFPKKITEKVSGKWVFKPSEGFSGKGFRFFEDTFIPNSLHCKKGLLQPWLQRLHDQSLVIDGEKIFVHFPDINNKGEFRGTNNFKLSDEAIFEKQLQLTKAFQCFETYSLDGFRHLYGVYPVHEVNPRKTMGWILKRVLDKLGLPFGALLFQNEIDQIPAEIVFEVSPRGAKRRAYIIGSHKCLKLR